MVQRVETKQLLLLLSLSTSIAPPSARLRKPYRKVTTQESSKELSQSPSLLPEPSTLADNSTLEPLAHPTIETETTAEQEVDLQAQINQSLSNNLRTTVSLTDKQFQGLLNQVSAAGSNQPLSSTKVPLKPP